MKRWRRVARLVGLTLWQLMGALIFVFLLLPTLVAGGPFFAPVLTVGEWLWANRLIILAVSLAVGAGLTAWAVWCSRRSPPPGVDATVPPTDDVAILVVHGIGDQVKGGNAGRLCTGTHAVYPLPSVQDHHV